MLTPISMNLKFWAFTACHLQCKLISVCFSLPSAVNFIIFHLFYLRGRPFSLPPFFANRSVCLKPFIERRIAFISSSQSSSSFFKSWNPCRLKVYNPSSHPSKQSSFQPQPQSPDLQKFPTESASGPSTTGFSCQ